MNPRWEPKTIEIEFHACSIEEEKRRLAEVAEVLYLYFCQLDQKSFPTETTASASFQHRRTGTDG